MTRRNVRWLSLMVLSLGGCTASEDLQLGQREDSVLGTPGNYAASSGDPMTFVMHKVEGETTSAICSGALSSWKDTRGDKKDMVTATTAAHCLTNEDSTRVLVFPAWKVKTKPVRIAATNWKLSAGAFSKKGGVGIAAICPNLVEKQKPWPVLDVMVKNNLTITLHGMRQVKNPDHPKEERVPGTGLGKKDVLGADDMKDVFKRDVKIVDRSGRVAVLEAWVTRPGDSGSNGQIDGKLAYVHSRYHKGPNAATDPHRAAGTAVTVDYLSRIWNADVDEVASTYDATEDREESGELPGVDSNEISCSSTAIYDMPGNPFGDIGVAPGTIDVVATGSANDVGEFWHPDFPATMLDTVNQPGKTWGGGAPSDATLTWTFTKRPGPTPGAGTICTVPFPGGPVTCTDGPSLPPSPPQPFRAQVIRWPDGVLVCDVCGMDAASCSEPEIPLGEARNYQVRFGSCAAPPNPGPGSGSGVGPGSGSGVGPGSGSGVGPGSGSGVIIVGPGSGSDGTGSGSDIDPGTGSGSDGTGSGSDGTGSGSDGAGSGSDIDPGPGSGGGSGSGVGSGDLPVIIIAEPPVGVGSGRAIRLPAP